MYPHIEAFKDRELVGEDLHDMNIEDHPVRECKSPSGVVRFRRLL